MSGEPKRFTVIIPTYRRAEIALETLKALEAQNAPGFNVIVVDQSETIIDAIRDYESAIFDYRYIHITTPGLPNARNVGIEHTSTEFAIFLDDDCIPEPDLVVSYDTIFRDLDPEFALVAGRVIEKGSNIFREGKGLVGGYVTRYGKTLKNFDTDSMGECEWAPGGNFGLRTQAYRQVGGFDVNFIGTAVMEDSDFGYALRRLGYRVLYDPRPVMVHLRIPTGGLRQTNPARAMEYRAHNSVYFFRKHGLRRYLPLVGLYTLAVACKELLLGNYNASGLFYSVTGFIRGLRTALPIGIMKK